MLYLTKSPGNCERRDGLTLAVASECIAGVRQCRQWRLFAEQSGKPIRIESGTTADRIASIVELSGRLRPLSTPQMQWALNSTINHYGYRLKSGMCTCMKCGHERLETRNGNRETLSSNRERMCLCPECGTQIEIKDTKERVIREKSYFNIITTIEDCQVVRMFLMIVEMRKGMKAKPAYLEIGQYFIVQPCTPIRQASQAFGTNEEPSFLIVLHRRA